LIEVWQRLMSPVSWLYHLVWWVWEMLWGIHNRIRPHKPRFLRHLQVPKHIPFRNVQFFRRESWSNGLKP
jgi:hypothetical protein